MTDLTIIGGGPAGIAAAVNAASEGLETVLITAHRGGQAAGSARIENYLGFPEGISGHALMELSCRQAARFGVRFLDDAAIALQRVAGIFHTLTLDGERIVSRAVLLAMGVQYSQLGVPGVELPEVTYGLDPHGRHDDKHVVIIGGANSAGQAALHAAKTAKHVTMLSRSPLEKRMSTYLINSIAAARNIDVAPGWNVQEVGRGGLDGGRPLRVSIGNGDGPARGILKADQLAIFIGAVPRTRWLPSDIYCDDRGFVLSDYDLRRVGNADRLPFETSVPRVFVAGDVRHGSIKRVAASAGEGAQAVNSIHRCLA